MKPETVYEIRTVVRGKISSRNFVSNFPELYDKFRTIDASTQVYIFKIVKDENGDVVSSNKLACNISNNSFVVKTIYEKLRRVPKDSGRIEVSPPSKERSEQVFDIAFLRASLAVSRAVKTASRTSGAAYRRAQAQTPTNSSFRKGKSPRRK